MESFLATSHTRDDETPDTVKLQTDLRKAFKYASSTSTPLPQTLSLELPQHLQDGLTEWLRGVRPGSGMLHIRGVLFQSDDDEIKVAEAGEPKHMLLSIPPEMRNRIYRAALLVDDEIVIPPDGPPPEEPALLRTCSQIRAEAMSIYYKENRFLVHINKTNADVYIKWCKASEHRMGTSHDFSSDGEVSWPNLMRWLEAYFKRECIGLGVSVGANCSRTRTVVHLFSMVSEMKGKGNGWQDIAEVLMRVRDIMALGDDGWTEE